MANKFQFDLIQKQFKTGALNAMREIAMANKNHFVKSFREQKWENKPWEEVQRRIKGTKAYEYPKDKGLRRRTRPILVGRGTLRRAVNASIKSVLPGKVTFLVRLKYAEVHNEGGRMKNGKRMPKRQFMGQSREMRKRNIEIIQKYAQKSFRSK